MCLKCLQLGSLQPVAVGPSTSGGRFSPRCKDWPSHAKKICSASRCERSRACPSSPCPRRRWKWEREQYGSRPVCFQRREACMRGARCRTDGRGQTQSNLPSAESKTGILPSPLTLLPFCLVTHVARSGRSLTLSETWAVFLRC